MAKVRDEFDPQNNIPGSPASPGEGQARFMVYERRNIPGQDGSLITEVQRYETKAHAFEAARQLNRWRPGWPVGRLGYFVCQVLSEDPAGDTDPDPDPQPPVVAPVLELDRSQYDPGVQRALKLIKNGYDPTSFDQRAA